MRFLINPITGVLTCEDCPERCTAMDYWILAAKHGVCQTVRMLTS